MKIEDLNKTVWYRLVKVLYVAFFLFAYVIGVGSVFWALFYPYPNYVYDGSVWLSNGTLVLIPVIGIPLVFWLFIGLFHYIVIGKFTLPIYRRKH